MYLKTMVVGFCDKKKILQEQTIGDDVIVQIKKYYSKQW